MSDASKLILKKVVADVKIPFLRGVLEPYAEVIYREGGSITTADVANADAMIVRTRTSCNAALLDGSKVRFIATATIGFDHIDVGYCAAHGITWASAPGCNSASVQQYIASALVHLSRTHGFKLADRTIGIVGVGNVGRKVARLCETLGMRVLLNDPPRARKEGPAGFVPLSTIVEQADLITLHVPLNAEGPDKTFQLVDGRFLDGLTRRPILINTSRGEVVVEQAVKEALRAKRLSGCVLDVWEQEPEVDLELLAALDLGTPHIAGYSADGKANGTSMSVQAVSRFFGLGIDDWFPAEVPKPANTTIDLNASGLSPEEVLTRLMHATYDIREDDRRLRTSPRTFEKQRGDYPVRREFPTYAVRLLNADAAVRQRVTHLGFRPTD